MTGFGYVVLRGRFASIKVEARAVNHRFAEFNIRIPRDLSRLEEDIRTVLSQRIARGRVDLYVSLEYTSPAPKRVAVDWSLLDALYALERDAASRYPERVERLNHSYEWLTYPEVLQIHSEDLNVEDIRPDVLGAVSDALESLCEMRLREGNRLKADMLLKLASLTDAVNLIIVRVPVMSKTYQEKLRGRMLEFSEQIDETKLLSEIAVWTERQTIDEELVRLQSHIDEFGSTLHRGSPAGRRLDFIVQEMHREINTIGSKASDLAISKSVVDAKVVIEQLREQTQNIE